MGMPLLRELKRGSTEVLILALLEERARHGYDIGRLIDERLIADWMTSAHTLRRRPSASAPPPPATDVSALTGLASDLRYGLRLLNRQRGFAAVAVLTIALAIGVTTTLFSVVYGVLLRP